MTGEIIIRQVSLHKHGPRFREDIDRFSYMQDKSYEMFD